MAVRFSSGLRNKMLGSANLKTALADGVINIYSGAQPASADSAVTGTLLMTITESAGAFNHGSAANGLEFDAPALGVISKAAAETWRGLGIAAGTAGYARFVGNPIDDGTASTTLPRIDMAIATTGSDLNLSTTTIAVDAPTTVDQFNLTMPES